MRIPWLRRKERADVPEYDLWLVCTGGALRGSACPITDQGPVTIGRGQGNAFRYPPDRPDIGRSHARIYWDQGRLLLMGLVPGVRMDDGGRLDPLRPREIRPGEGFGLGDGPDRFEIRN